MFYSATYLKLFFREGLTSLNDAVQLFRVETKVDSIFCLLTHHHRISEPEDAKIFSSSYNLEAIEQSWEPASSQSRAGQQASTLRYWENTAFIIGSMLIIASKLLPQVLPSYFF